MMTTNKALEYYLKLNYSIQLSEDPESGLVFAEHPDLEGCLTQGESPNEAVANLREARALWLSARHEAGLPIPEPLPDDASGKVLVRMPPWLHTRLLGIARDQRSSLNHIITTALSEFSGGRATVGMVRDSLQEYIRMAFGRWRYAESWRHGLSCRSNFWSPSAYREDPSPLVYELREGARAHTLVNYGLRSKDRGDLKGYGVSPLPTATDDDKRLMA